MKPYLISGIAIGGVLALAGALIPAPIFIWGGIGFFVVLFIYGLIDISDEKNRAAKEAAYKSHGGIIKAAIVDKRLVNSEVYVTFKVTFKDGYAIISEVKQNGEDYSRFIRYI